MLNEAEQKYVTAAVNPFNEFCSGVRIPNVVNDSTIALRDHQSAMLTIGATG